jgi:membrane protein
MRFLKKATRIAVDAFYAFSEDDGWALASHIAMSALLALFPFLIFLTALAGFFGSKDIADNLATLLLDTWPEQAAGPISREIHNVVGTTRSDVLTISVVIAIYFASSGVDSLRIALNRAYNVAETRWFWLLKLESIAYVLLGAFASLALGFLIILAPLAFATALKYAPWLAPQEQTFTYTRYAVAATAIVVALIVAHKWLPGGRRRFVEIWPGIVVTLILWLAGGFGFGRYLAEFANNYVTMYAGLASAMIALVFLYWIATIFVYGGELNAEIIKDRARTRAAVEAERIAVAAAEAERHALANQPAFQKLMRRLGYEKKKR